MYFDLINWKINGANKHNSMQKLFPSTVYDELSMLK